MSDDETFHRYVTLERASRVTGTPVGTLREWLRKGAIQRFTNPGGHVVLVDMHELQPRPKPDAGPVSATA